MASDRDLTHGRQGEKHDELLERVDGLLPPWLTDDSTPMGVIAKVIWLDQQAGKDSPDNVIWAAAGYAVWILMCVEIADPEVKRLMESSDPEDEEELEKITTFKVRFAYPENSETFPYPDWMNGQERTLRVWGEEEAERDLPAVFTATPDGKQICLH